MRQKRLNRFRSETIDSVPVQALAQDFGLQPEESVEKDLQAEDLIKSGTGWAGSKKAAEIDELETNS